MAFSDKTKDDAHKRSGGRCECTRTGTGHEHTGRCPTKVTRTGAQYHHRTAQGSGGDDSLSNCEVLCVPCHKATGSYGRS